MGASNDIGSHAFFYLIGQIRQRVTVPFEKMNKFIIALTAPNETGKTTALKRLWEKLTEDEKLPGVNLHPRKLFEIIGYVDFVNPKSKKQEPCNRIGINSRGDIVEQNREGFVELIDNNCNIIVCSCHSEDELNKAINTLLKTKKEILDKLEIDEMRLKEIQNLIESYHVIQFSHLIKKTERMSLKKRKSMGETFDPNEGETDLINLSADFLYDLITKLL